MKKQISEQGKLVSGKGKRVSGKGTRASGKGTRVSGKGTQASGKGTRTSEKGKRAEVLFRVSGEAGRRGSREAGRRVSRGFETVSKNDTIAAACEGLSLAEKKVLVAKGLKTLELQERLKVWKAYENSGVGDIFEAANGVLCQFTCAEEYFESIYDGEIEAQEIADGEEAQKTAECGDVKAPGKEDGEAPGKKAKGVRVRGDYFDLNFTAEMKEALFKILTAQTCVALRCYVINERLEDAEVERHFGRLARLLNSGEGIPRDVLLPFAEVPVDELHPTEETVQQRIVLQGLLELVETCMGYLHPKWPDLAIRARTRACEILAALKADDSHLGESEAWALIDDIQKLLWATESVLYYEVENRWEMPQKYIRSVRERCAFSQFFSSSHPDIYEQLAADQKDYAAAECMLNAVEGK